MSRTPESNGSRTPSARKGGINPLPLILVAVAIVVVAALYFLLRNQPNYQEEGELGDQPAPIPSETTS